MHILYISNARFPTEKAHGLQIMKTCEAFADMGHSVELLASNRPNPMHEDPFTYYRVRRNFKITTATSHGLPLGDRLGFLIRYLTFSLAVAFSVSARTCDILYGRDEIALACVSLITGRRVIWESHVGGWNVAARFLAKRLKLLVVISQGLKNLYVSRGIPAEHIVVAHDAVDIEEFSRHEDTDAARRRLYLPLDKKVAMYIGRLDGWKGSDTLFGASKLLPEDVVLAIIGGEPAQVETLRAKHPNIIFLGHRPYRELPDNQAAADVLILPNSGTTDLSARYTSPLKLFTYMMSEKPIVASDLPSIREILDESTAYLVRSDDSKALSDGIQRALRDPNAQSKARAARSKAGSYSWKRRVARILDAVTKSP